MIDIVERLRAEATDNRRYEVSGTLATEAADTITRLTAEVEQNAIDLEEYRRDVERLRAALKEIAKPTYGTEFHMSDEDRADILGRHLFAKQDLARAALSGDNNDQA
jgi:hypothetical protein